MNYEQTVQFLYSKLPMFTKIGAAAIKKDLHNTLALCEVLDNPHKKFRSIHIAGTNGKGSTSHMLASVLQKAGYKTGLYTSPHLKDFRERIRINGKMISKSEVVNFVKTSRDQITAIQPSFFEVTVAMAFDYFAKHQVDVAVVEVGLGGRLDSTNIITPELSVITNISFDHIAILGNSLKEIAFEKAGIIKKNIPVVIGEYHPDTSKVFDEKAKQENSKIWYADQLLTLSDAEVKNGKLNFEIRKDQSVLLKHLKLDLTGTYQQKNVLTVIQSILELRENGFNIDDKAIFEGLQDVKKISGLKGRWQTIQKKPLIICDTGHNEAGISEVIKNIATVKFEKLHMVIGMVKDKDISSVLELLPQNGTYYFCAPKLERALAAQDLAILAQEKGLHGNVFSSIKEALAAAINQANEQDLIFVGGSTFVVAEII